jgi:hypothetical protein
MQYAAQCFILHLSGLEAAGPSFAYTLNLQIVLFGMRLARKIAVNDDLPFLGRRTPKPAPVTDKLPVFRAMWRVPELGGRRGLFFKHQDD